MDERRMCPHCRAFITTHDRVCPYCNERVGPRAVDRRSPGDIVGGFIPHARFVTVMILLVNFGLFLATSLYEMRTNDPRTLIWFGAKYTPAMIAGQWWRLVTAGFLHGGILHILMNSWVLFDLGAQVEEMYGGARMFTIYFIGTIVGFLASTFWSPALSVGSSAGIFGLIGAMIALGVSRRANVQTGMYVRWVVYMMLFGLLPGFAVDNAAHVGGLAGGFACGYVAGIPGYSTAQETFWRIASYICLALTGWSFLKMFLWFSSRVLQ